MRRYQKEDSSDVLLDRNLHYHSYSSALEIKKDFASKKPLSVVRLADGRFACVVRRATLLWTTPIEGTAREINCQQYNEWVLADVAEPVDSFDIASSLLFLPFLRHPKPPGMYTVINSRWEEYRNGVFQLPELLKQQVVAV